MTDETPIGAKVAYVKRQRQTRSHHCHWPGCDKQVPPATCGYCGAWLTVVRPGKHQCDCCSDGRDLGAIARAALSALRHPEGASDAGGEG